MMAQYKIKTKQYCNLSQEQKWQSWLQSVSEELHNDLMLHLTKSRSCKANQEKMQEILKGLEKRKLTEVMVKFLLKEYPYTIEEIGVARQEAPKLKPVKVLKDVKNTDVFEYYHPNLLTFPQKIVIENDDPVILDKEVREFCKGKIGVDYIIVGNKAFIEYFKLKYAKEAKKILPHRREIYKYRLKYGIAQHDKVANIGYGYAMP